jgi:hypothetical protein
MHRIIVARFVSLDGVTEDPDGSAGSPHGAAAGLPAEGHHAVLSDE